MDLLLHAGFGETVAHMLPQILDLGFRWVINGPIVTDKADEKTMAQLLDEFAQPGAPKLLWKAHSLDIAEFGAASGIPSAIELFGEPDLDWSSQGWPDYSQDVPAYKAFLLEGYERIRHYDPDIPILGGNVSSLSVRGRDYLTALEPATWPADIVFNWHAYPCSWPPHLIMEPPYIGHSGLYTREMEWRWLHQLAAGRTLWTSEWGYTNGLHTKWQPAWPQFPIDLTWQWTEDETKDYILIDLDMQKEHGVQVSGLYQWTDDPALAEKDGGCYGIHRVDGSEKPVCNALRAWAAAHPSTT